MKTTVSSAKNGKETMKNVAEEGKIAKEKATEN